MLSKDLGKKNIDFLQLSIDFEIENNCILQLSNDFIRENIDLLWQSIDFENAYKDFLGLSKKHEIKIKDHGSINNDFFSLIGTDNSRN